MTTSLHLTVGANQIEIPIRRVIIAGFAGRDRRRVQEHIDELALHGIPAPPTVPAFYPVSPDLISQEPEFSISTSTASGEAEAVLVFPSGTLEDAVVTVGSDLTDRILERESIQRSKELPKPVGRNAWRFKDVRDRWDDLQLASWVTKERSSCYQKGTLGALLEPERVLAAMPGEFRNDLAGTVIFSGTIPLCQPQFAFSDYFSCELIDPADGVLHCEYGVKMPRLSPTL